MQVSFDPIAEKEPDPYGALGETMEQKKKSDENLIAFGPLDEFDPVAHQFEGTTAKEESFDPNSGAKNEGDLLGLGASGPQRESRGVLHVGFILEARHAL